MRLQIIVTDSTGKVVKVPYTIVDNNTIRFTSKSDMSGLRLSMQTTDPANISAAKKMGEVSVRFLMLVRRLSVMYKETNSLVIPGFNSEAGFMGQQEVDNAFAPGFDFAFGMPKRDYLEQAVKNGWVIMNDSIINPASQTFTSDFDVKLNLEPFAGFKIDLNTKDKKLFH